MDMLIMRHGSAQTAASSDRERQLTAVGEAEVTSMAHLLVRQGVNDPLVCHSHYTRARQSAAIMQQQLGGESREYSELAPDRDPAIAVALLQGTEAPSVLCVAHQPLVGAMVNYLVDGDAAWGRPFATGAIALLRCEFPGPAGASLVWYREPGIG